MASINSKWKGDAKRVSKTDKVEDARWVKMPTAKGFQWRLEEDRVTEADWVGRRREGEGWKNGAKVSRKAG